MKCKSTKAKALAAGIIFYYGTVDEHDFLFIPPSFFMFERVAATSDVFGLKFGLLLPNDCVGYRRYQEQAAESATVAKHISKQVVAAVNEALKDLPPAQVVPATEVLLLKDLPQIAGIGDAAVAGVEAQNCPAGGDASNKGPEGAEATQTVSAGGDANASKEVLVPATPRSEQPQNDEVVVVAELVPAAEAREAGEAAKEGQSDEEGKSAEEKKD